MKKTGFILLFLILSMLIASGNILAADFDYDTALEYSLIFFDANKCGPEAGEDNYFDWRGACHTKDGEDVDIDLNGGYHDAGDHVKFGLPQAYAAATLAWTLYEYEDVFEQSGTKDRMLSTLKYFADYLIKCYDGSNFYYQVGDGEEDHTYWGAPEEQTEDRPTPLVANMSSPGSDVLGLTSAALSLMYLNYQDIDSSYAEECLETAKALYEMGKENPGYYDVQAFYISGSYYDDLAWAGIWLGIAENDQSYITEAEEFAVQPNKYGDDPMEHKWTMCWDDMYLPAMYKLYDLTGDDKYKTAVEFNLDYWLNDITETPAGLPYLHNWGVLRYSSAQAMIAALYYDKTGEQSYYDFAKFQIDYILGDNPESMSYVIGFGEKWSKHPHHRAANGHTYANNGNAKEAKHLLTGALVGGPDQDDVYIDDGNQYQYTEVAIDYNASFVAGLAAYMGADGENDGGDNVDDNDNDDDNDGNDDDNDDNDEILLGDLNNDDVVDSIDYSLLRRHLTGHNIEINLEAADINEDSYVDSLDITLLRKSFLGN